MTGTLLDLAAGLLAVAGMVLIFDDIRLRRHDKPDLYERLKRYQPPGVADQAERWLQSRR